MKLLSRVQLLATPWTAAYQAPLSMGFSRQEYWSGVPLPREGSNSLLQGIFPTQGSNPGLLHCRRILYSLSHPAAATAKSLQSCPPLCDPIDGSPSGSPSLGFSRPRILEWVAISFSNECMKMKSENEVAQSCPTLSNPMDCSLPGSSVHGIFQARVLEPP